MKSTVEALEGNKVKLSISVDEEEFEKDLDAAFRRIAREVRLPGFRPGKAPRAVLEARIGLEAARIEALYSVAPYENLRRIVVTDFADLGAFRQATSSSSVLLQLEAASGETRGGDRNLRLRAENKGAARRGAWAKAGLVCPAPYRNLTGAGALGVWVKGDGKGALLNIQLATPREYMHALSDHHVLLDFTGWRYVELLFRERDVERMSDYQWPYDGSYDLHRNPLDTAHISEVNLYLNDLPAGESTEVIVGPIIALPVQPAELKNPALTVNGRKLALPVTLKSGDFVELEPTGDSTHYDEKGDLLAWVRPTMAAAWPLLKSGQNTVAFDCDKPAGVSARAEVTVNASGAPFGTSSARARVGWKHLAREYEMPRWITAPDEANNLWELRVRPGETARLEIELSGGMDMPVLTVNGHALRFPVQLKPRQRLICRDQRHWTVLGANRVPVAKGDLVTSPPRLKSGLNHLSFTCGTPDHVTVRLVKVYEP